MKHVNVQNGKLWGMSQKNEVIARADLLNLELAQPPIIDENIIKRKNIRKLYVDKDGVHCILMSEHELFYCNWNDNHIYQINTNVQDSASGRGFAGPRGFRSIEIFHEDGDQNCFEILLGTKDGQIYHTAMEYSDGSLEVFEHLSSVIELPEAKEVLDIKIASFADDEKVVLAVTETTLY